MGYRLPTGGRIDRARPLRWRWNHRELTAFAGDTIASALLANDIRIVGRSFKFHRPRGLLAAGVEEPNALVTLGHGAETDPSACATMIPVREGLEVRSQNAWPGIGFDLARIVDALAPLFPAGFYNKTFLWPSWHLYEPWIRRAAGLGPAPRLPDPARYETISAHCDLLVAGGGPAGLSAALAAARAGLAVILADQDCEFGGGLLGSHERIDGTPAMDWVGRVVAELRTAPRATLLPATTVFGLYDHGHAGLLQRLDPASTAGQLRQRYWRVHAAQTLVATGAIEQPLVFEYNDLPGILLAGAIRRYANRHAVAAGRRIVFATNNDSAYVAALDLASAGVAVPLLLDSRDEVPATLAAALREQGIEVAAGTVVVRAQGRRRLRGLRIGHLRANGSVGDLREITCDALGMSGGWVPTVHLSRQRNVATAGAAAAAATATVVRTPAGRARRQWLDFQHDVTVADIELAVREGYEHIEHVKRYTTAGMSIDQGRTSNRNTMLTVAAQTGRDPAAIGTTTFRPPYTPVTLGALAGRRTGERYAPRRRLPAHTEHEALGAQWWEAGGWMRPSCYPHAGETAQQAIRREALAVRSAAGIYDASPLGKIQVTGADAGVFLDRFYCNNMRTLAPGRVRYGLMLNEAGVIIDDGTVARLDADRWLVTTTSGAAARIGLWLDEWRQCEWPELEVCVTPVTAQWATVALSGPRAREILARLGPDFPIDGESLPHLSVREGHLAGVPARLYRVSYSGELGYELNVPARCGAALWRRLLAAGADAGITPYGIETVLLLRLEKGFLHVGVDTDGTTAPADVGWGEIAAKKNADFIGRRSLTRADNRRADRLQLVGLTGTDAGVLVPGAHLRLAGTREGSDGWVTSAAVSPVLGRPIALALLRGGHARRGERVAVHDLDRQCTAEVVAAPFYDPQGVRLHA
jgi:sarcosine oxidase subunit alpha